MSAHKRASERECERAEIEIGESAPRQENSDKTQTLKEDRPDAPLSMELIVKTTKKGQQHNRKQSNGRHPPPAGPSLLPR